MKFGGSSLISAGLIQNTVNIIKNHLHSQPVVVVSAMGKTTRNLLTVAQNAANGSLKEAQLLLKDQVLDYHLEIINSFKSYRGYNQLIKKINIYNSEIITDLGMIVKRQEISPFLQDKVLSYGELMSSSILNYVLVGNGIRSKLLDARYFILTDNCFTHANPIRDKCYSEIQHNIEPLIRDSVIPITQGYIGATSSGEATTLGFEGSDYSAVLIGAALGVDEIQTWKDVNGILSSDPTMIAKTQTITHMSYDEAGELSRCGAKVLHLETIKPAREKNIPLKICNINNPALSYTTIDDHDQLPSVPVKSITFKEKLTHLQIFSKGVIAEIDFIAKVFSSLKTFDIVPFHIVGSSNHLDLVIPDFQATDILKKDLNTIASLEINHEKATISLIGDISKIRDEISGVVSTYVAHNIILREMVSNSCTFLIDSKDLTPILNILHAYYFKDGSDE